MWVTFLSRPPIRTAFQNEIYLRSGLITACGGGRLVAAGRSLELAGVHEVNDPGPAVGL